MNLTKTLYADITKAEEQEDGTIKVWGYASSGSEDSDGEVITPDAMKAAIPDYMKFGAVREMHQNKAAGTAIEAEVQEDGRTYFGAHVVDSEAVKKVKANVYKGFSIGGKVTARDDVNKSVIKSLKLVEVSLVDRPANPDAVFTMYKAETIEDEGGEEKLRKVEEPVVAKTEEPASEPEPKTEIAKTEVKDTTLAAVDELAELLDKSVIAPEKLVELAKAYAANPEILPIPADEGQVEKGMWNVQDFAAALQELAYICMCAEWDKQSEGDDSPIPAQLRDWIGQGVQIFKDMAAEELDEMMSLLREQSGEVMMAAAKAGELEKADEADLTKAGAKYSAETKKSLQAVHKSAKDCVDRLESMGIIDKDGGGDDDVESAATGDLNKLESNTIEVIQKFTKENENTADLLNKMAARITELESLPTIGKAFLKSVSKSDDIGDTIETVTPIKKSDGTVDEATTLIKGIHKSGGKPLLG